MKTDLIVDSVTPVTVDRLATSDEIRAAVLSFPGTIEEYTMETQCEIAADFGGYVRITDVEFETSLLVEELTRERESDTWAN